MSVQVVKRSFTVAEYRRMVEVGILSEDDRVELIDGEVFEMSPIREPRAASVDVLNEIVRDRLGRSVIVRVQGPIQLGDFSEPQPDVSILKRREDFYRGAHPRPEDVLLVIEVSDSTLVFDRKVKVPLYARAGIPEAWVVNLPEERVEVYSDPVGGEYQTVRSYARGRRVESHALTSLRISVSKILG
ncbi:MAG TPA: Uma2 family endonuclease [Pyrinomonadaceae bacterium]